MFVKMSGCLRSYDALLDVSLPGFVIPDTAFGLFASQFHFLGYIVDALSSVFLLVEPVTRRSQIMLVRKGPFCFYFLGGLYAPCLWHASWLPSGGIF